MELPIFLAAIVGVLVYGLWRTRRGGISDYVPGSEEVDEGMLADETNMRLAQFPGPGGPMDGTGGNVIGGG